MAVVSMYLYNPRGFVKSCVVVYEGANQLGMCSTRLLSSSETDEGMVALVQARHCKHVEEEGNRGRKG